MNGKFKLFLVLIAFLVAAEFIVIKFPGLITGILFGVSVLLMIVAAYYSTNIFEH